MHTVKDFHDAQTTHSVFPCTGSWCTRRFFQYLLYVHLMASWLRLTTVLSPRLLGLPPIVSQIRGISGGRGRDDIVGAVFTRRFSTCLICLSQVRGASRRSKLATCKNGPICRRRRSPSIIGDLLQMPSFLMSYTPSAATSQHTGSSTIAWLILTIPKT